MDRLVHIDKCHFAIIEYRKKSLFIKNGKLSLLNRHSVQGSINNILNKAPLAIVIYHDVFEISWNMPF